MIVHVRSDITERIDCGLRAATRLGALALTITRTEYLGMLHWNNVAEAIRLKFGEGARLCRRCARAA